MNKALLIALGLCVLLSFVSSHPQYRVARGAEEEEEEEEEDGAEEEETEGNGLPDAVGAATGGAQCVNGSMPIGGGNPAENVGETIGNNPVGSAPGLEEIGSMVPGGGY